MNEEMLDKVVERIEKLIDSKILYESCRGYTKQQNSEYHQNERTNLRNALMELFDNSQTETIEITAKEIRQEGYSAGFCNCGGKHNPYPEHSQNYNLWEEGFQTGQWET